LNRLCALACLLAFPLACLPKDTRPPPSVVLFTASPSEATQTGRLATETADGWSIEFERVLVAIGRVSLDGDDCSVYSDAGYARLLNLIGAPDSQKVSDSYALGQCDFGFAIGNPQSESPLGAGATKDDLAFMRTAGSDHYGGPTGISLYVAGSATKGGQQLTFAWPFRGRARYRECASLQDGKLTRGFDLKEDGEVTVNVVVHAEALFAESIMDPNSALRFDAIASADALGNADGEVTFDELRLVMLTDLQGGDAYVPNKTNQDIGLLWSTLEDFIYLGAAPNVARFQGTGACDAELGEPPRGG
jgi:hypothetical protein